MWGAQNSSTFLLRLVSSYDVGIRISDDGNIWGVYQCKPLGTAKESKGSCSSGSQGQCRIFHWVSPIGARAQPGEQDFIDLRSDTRVYANCTLQLRTFSLCVTLTILERVLPVCV